MLDYGAHGELEAADHLRLRGRRRRRAGQPALRPRGAPGASSPAPSTAPAPFCATYRDPAFLASLAGQEGSRHLDDDFELVQDTFRRFADEKLKPIAEHIHRHNDDIPEDIISGLGEMGAFGLSIPEEYGGYGSGGESEYIGMVVATEELSRGSLGAGGSLITRPEIFTRAARHRRHRGAEARVAAQARHRRGPERHRRHRARRRAATRPPSPPAPRRTDGGWLINGVKTWCTFGARADVLLLLARTDPDRSIRHKGLSLFIVPKERGDGHGFELTQDGRREDGGPRRSTRSATAACTPTRSPSTPGSSRTPTSSAARTGIGRGFYLQMAGFENGRLQTAARAIGVMQAAYEAAKQYAADRVVFDRPIAEFQLTQVKLARMADHHPGRPPGELRRRPADGQGPRARSRPPC